MNILKRVKKENINFLMDLNYNNLFLHLKQLNGKGNLLFAGIQIMQNEILWQFDNKEEYMPLTEADKDIYERVCVDVQLYLQNMYHLIESNPLLKPYANVIVTYPSDEYVFFKIQDMKCFIVIAGWGCELKKNRNQEEKEEEASEILTNVAQEDISKIVDSLVTSQNSENGNNKIINETNDSLVTQMTFINAIKTCYRKYATFKGRATRKEYWYFYLYNMLITWALLGLSVVFDSNPQIFGIILVITFVFILFSLLPSFAVGVRRLHDTGRSGWDFMIAFIPFIGGLIIFYFLCSPSDKTKNIYD